MGKLYQYGDAIFSPNKRKRIDPDKAYPVEQVADILGTSPATVRALDSDGVVTTREGDDGSLAVRGRDLQRFMDSKLREVALAGSKPSAKAANGTESSNGSGNSNGNGKKALERPRQNAKATLVPTEDDEFDLVEPCPKCGDLLGISDDVSSFYCPSCGSHLSIEREAEDDEEDEGDDEDERPISTVKVRTIVRR